MTGNENSFATTLYSFKVCDCMIIPYSGKLAREKTYTNFVVLWLFVEVLSANLGAWCLLAQHKRAIQELQENRIFHQFTKVFSLKSFPLYSMLLEIQIVKFSRTLIIGASAVSPTLAENCLQLFMFVWYMHILYIYTSCPICARCNYFHIACWLLKRQD